MTIKDYEVNEQQFSYLIIHNIVILVQQILYVGLHTKN